jgi:hypothetical protein
VVVLLGHAARQRGLRLQRGELFALDVEVAHDNVVGFGLILAGAVVGATGPR